MSIYASNKAMFEIAFDKAAEAIKDGDVPRYLELRKVLLDCYNSAVDNNERMLQRYVELSNLTPPKIISEGITSTMPNDGRNGFGG